MSDRVLVAYATKYGATAEIAQRIGTLLQEEGFPVDVLDVAEVRDVAPYVAVVIGSAVYAGAWRKEAVALVIQHADELAERPVWLFSSGPTGAGDPVERMDGWRYPDELRSAVQRIHPRGIAFFHGKIDLAKLNLAEKLMVKAVRAQVGDFRDWEAIGEWAAGIAHSLPHIVR